jgi:hypoxanthine phosphoribosyltransferase
LKAPKLVSWNEFGELTSHVAAHLSYDVPDCIVGLARGGLVPAVRLSHMLNIPMVTLNMSLRDDKVGELELSQLHKYNNIAIVDDICDSGKTFHILDIHLQDAGFTNIQWCTLYSKATAMFEPTIVGEVINEIDNSQWVVFPWEE